MNNENYKSISIIVDTNFFEECKQPKEIDWTQLEGGYDEIKLIVTRPVQAELDRHKKGDRNRIRNRAIEATSLLRKIIDSDQSYIVVQEANPKVIIELDILLKPDAELGDSLDYSEPDNKIVGCLSSFFKKDKNVILISHDTGPISTAKAMELPCQFIPKSWVLPPQTTDADKTISRLEAENQLLKSKEPKIEILCSDSDGNTIEKVKFQIIEYSQLSKNEILELLEQVKALNPIVTDLKSSNKSAPTYAVQVWGEPSQEALSKYVEEYDEWIHRMKEALNSVHTKLRSQNVLSFELKNSGTVTADSVLIKFETKGDIGFRLYSNQNGLYNFPNCPKAPMGSWESPISSWNNQLANIMLASHKKIYTPKYETLNIISKPNIQKKEDQFFWYSKKPKDITNSAALECKLWRHGEQSERYEYEFCALNEKNLAKGIMECTIQATNLTTSYKLRIPIEIKSETRSPFEKVRDLIEETYAWPFS